MTIAAAAADVAGTSLLHDEHLLSLTLSFLEGESVFVLTVSKIWAASFRKLEETRKSGNLICSHTHSSSCTFPGAAYASSARLRLACQWGFKVDASSAGMHCSKATLQTAYELGLTSTEEVACGAAASGDLEKLVWLVDEQQCPLTSLCITAMAASTGNMQMLRWLKQRGCVFGELTSLLAAGKAKNVPVLQFLLSEGCKWHSEILGRAAAVGDLEQLQWLHQHGVALRSSVSWSAAGRGSMAMYEWFQQQGVQFECMTLEYAAAHNRLQLCDWLRSAGCPWDETCYFTPAERGALQGLSWLLQHGCPYSIRGMAVQAMLGGRAAVPVLEFLLQQGLLSDVALLSQLLLDAGAMYLPAAKWLRERGAEWPTVWPYNTSEWGEDAVAWARAEGFEGLLPEGWSSSSSDDYSSDESGDSYLNDMSDNSDSTENDSGDSDADD
jgi:hypothetical protein